MVLSMYSQGPEGRMRNLLIIGADHQERVAYATSLSLTLLCQQQSAGCRQCHNCMRVLGGTHPNVIIIEPLGSDAEGASKEISLRGDIKIEQIRRVIVESAKANYEEGTAIFVITHMHQITKAAANALLKSIEESSDKKVFFALAPSKVSVLPTIASRLIAVHLKPAPQSEELPMGVVEIIRTITAKPSEERFPLTKQFAVKRPELLAELASYQDVCHALLRAFFDSNHPMHAYALAPPVANGISQALHNAMEHLHNNASPLLVVEQMLFHHWPYA